MAAQVPSPPGSRQENAEQREARLSARRPRRVFIARAWYARTRIRIRIFFPSAKLRKKKILEQRNVINECDLQQAEDQKVLGCPLKQDGV